MNKIQRYRVRKAKEVWAVLCLDAPEVFSREYPLPLKIGIHEDIEERYGDRFARHKFIKFFYWWTRRSEYRTALKTAPFRYDLDGNQYELLDEHRETTKATVCSDAPVALDSKNLKRGSL